MAHGIITIKFKIIVSMGWLPVDTKREVTRRSTNYKEIQEGKTGILLNVDSKLNWRIERIDEI